MAALSARHKMQRAAISRCTSQASSSQIARLAGSLGGLARARAAACGRPQAAGIRCEVRNQRVAATEQVEATSGTAEVAAAAPEPVLPSLVQRLLASCSPADSHLLLLAAALGGWVLLGATVGAEPAAAAASTADSSQHGAQLLGDLAEGEDFWSNVLRYLSYFFSVLLGTAYVAARPIVDLLKRPTTAVVVVLGLVGILYFVSFTVKAMLGVGEPFDYTPSSIVTPALSYLSALHLMR